MSEKAVVVHERGAESGAVRGEISSDLREVINALPSLPPSFDLRGCSGQSDFKPRNAW